MASGVHWLLIAAWTAIMVSACGNSQPRVTVLAASSLQDVVPGILAQSDLPDVRVSFAASSTLARQLEAGAAGDIFLSASTQWVDRLEEKGLIDGASRAQFLRNRLVLVAHPDALAVASELSLPDDLVVALGANQRLAIGDPAHVPAGRYARAALIKLGLWSALESRTALGDNVRAALALVARGEAPFGIVYFTDAALEPRLQVVAEFAADAQMPVQYSFVLINRRRAPGTDAVYRALTGPVARERFRDAGFVVQ